MPVIHVKGTDSGPVFEAAEQYFRSLVPTSNTVALPAVNHLLQMKDPGLVAKTLAAFWSDTVGP